MLQVHRGVLSEGGALGSAHQKGLTVAVKVPTSHAARVSRWRYWTSMHDIACLSVLQDIYLVIMPWLLPVAENALQKCR